MTDEARSRQLWNAVAGRYGRPTPADPAAAVRAMRDAGATRSEIAAVKKDLASTLGVSVRQVQRMTTATGRERRGSAKHADRIRDHLTRDPRVRQASAPPRRAARMRNLGARVHISGNQGPVVGDSDGKRLRDIERHIDGARMAAIYEAWREGDDEAAREALREALEEEGYPSWEWDDDAAIEFLAERREPE